MMIPSSKYFIKSTMRNRHSLNATHTRLIRVAFAAFALLLVSTVVGSSLLIIRNRAGEEATHSESLVPDNELFEHKEGKVHDAGPSISPTSSTSIPTYTASHEPTIWNTNASSSHHPISWPSASNPESGHPSTFSSESPTELISDLPSITQSKNSGNNVGDFDDIQFYVLGDIPYNRKEEKILKSQLETVDKSVVSKNDTSIFVVHVGDLMSANFSKCSEDKFRIISTMFQESLSTIPVLTTPGDNEWNKCPDVNAAIRNYTQYFVGLENHWNIGNQTRSDIFNSFERSLEKRSENWSFHHSNVLFISINMVASSWSEDSESKRRIDENIEWFDENCNKYSCESSRAVIIFGHSISNARKVFDHIHERIGPLQIPVVYFTGNGHQYMIKRGVGEGAIGKHFWRVQVDNGKRGPPILVTIQGNRGQNELHYDNFTSNAEGRSLIGGFMEIDQRLWANKTGAG